MTIKWTGAHPNNYTVGRSGKTIDKIVLHWIVGTLESADGTFANPDREASAHYGIGDSDIHQYVQEDDTAWHAGNWSVNQGSIGIEHEGGWLLDNGTRKVPTNKTHETSAELVADICGRHNIPIDRDHIKVHNEYSATQCPGTLDVDRIIELARGVVSVPTPEIIKDPQAKLDLGPDWGIKELQATVSTLNDQKRDLENAQSVCDERVEVAVESVKTERNEFWQLKLDTANETIEALKQQTAENTPWRTLMSIAWKKWWRIRKSENT